MVRDTQVATDATGNSVLRYCSWTWWSAEVVVSDVLGWKKL